jgi:hypothetical protein
VILGIFFFLNFFPLFFFFLFFFFFFFFFFSNLAKKNCGVFFVAEFLKRKKDSSLSSSK